MRERLEERGFVLCAGTVSSVDRSRLLDLVTSAQESSNERGSKTYAIRSLLAASPQLSELLGVVGVDGVVSAALDRTAEPLDATFFDKNAETNWKVPACGCPTRTVVGGDALCLSIAAASIVAKVTRDRAMARLSPRFPGYGWAQNVGYATPVHRAALAALGPTPHHRMLFGVVRQLSLVLEMPAPELPAED